MIFELKMKRRGEMKKPKILKNKMAMIGVEAAIILIAFVITAAAFSFMVVNMGLFATQRGRDTISQGLQEASTPLMLDGSILICSDGTYVNGTVIPLKTLGVKYVPMANETTVVSIRIEEKAAYANIYNGTFDIGATKAYNYLLSQVDSNANKTAAKLFIENSNGDESLNSQEKGYLVIYLHDGVPSGTDDRPTARTHVLIEIRPEKGAPLSIEFTVPSELEAGWQTIG